MSDMRIVTAAGVASTAAHIGGFARYGLTVIITLRDQPPAACADFCQPRVPARPAISGWRGTKSPPE